MMATLAIEFCQGSVLIKSKNNLIASTTIFMWWLTKSLGFIVCGKGRLEKVLSFSVPRITSGTLDYPSYFFWWTSFMKQHSYPLHGPFCELFEGKGSRFEFWKLIQYVPYIDIKKYLYKKHNFMDFKLNQEGNQRERIIRFLKSRKGLWL